MNSKDMQFDLADVEKIASQLASVDFITSNCSPGDESTRIGALKSATYCATFPTSSTPIRSDKTLFLLVSPMGFEPMTP
jgi:hypothetical protein